MSTLPRVVKRGASITIDPQGKIPMAVDWTRFLHGLGDTTPEIATSTWSVIPLNGAPAGGVDVDNKTIEAGGKRSLVRLVAVPDVSGESTIWTAANNFRYAVTNHIISNGTPVGEDDCTFYVRVVQH